MKSKFAALTAILLCITFITNGQVIEKGRNFLNGTFGINKKSFEAHNTTNNTFQDKYGNISLKYGKFF